MPLNVDRIIAHIWQAADEDENVQVLGLLDAAVDESIYPNLMAADNKKVNLFRGDKAQEMALVAPYLVRFEPDDSFTRWVVDKGWQNNWGIFMRASADFAALKRHMRSLFQVYDEEGNSLFFRYYDPRIMRTYLPTCNREELLQFFGPISNFCVSDEKADTLLCFRLSENGLLTEKKMI